MEQIIVRSVLAGIEALARFAPSVAAVFTGGKSLAELEAAAKEAIDKLPKRTGTNGLWDADLARRKAAGADPEKPETD